MLKPHPKFSHAQYIDRERIRFAMYLDENGISLEEGTDLAFEMGETLHQVAQDREDYLPREMGVVDA